MKDKKTTKETKKNTKGTYSKGTIYVEPADYFPKEIRKEFGLGEYAPKNKE